SPAKSPIIYYVVAFLVGYREETFRELLKRAVDLILKPSESPPTAPAVKVRLNGDPKTEIDFGSTAANVPVRKILQIQNSGTAPLATPGVTLTPDSTTPVGTFNLISDQVSNGGDLAPYDFRTVEIEFKPAAQNDFTATLTVSGMKLPLPV